MTTPLPKGVGILKLIIMKRFYRVYKAKKDIMWKGKIIYKEGDEIYDPIVSKATFFTDDAEDNDN